MSLRLLFVDACARTAHPQLGCDLLLLFALVGEALVDAGVGVVHVGDGDGGRRVVVGDADAVAGRLQGQAVLQPGQGQTCIEKDGHYCMYALDRRLLKTGLTFSSSA